MAVPVDWPAPEVRAEPPAAAAETSTAPAAQEEPASQAVAAGEPATPVLDEEDADDELILGAVALALGQAPPLEAEPPIPADLRLPVPDLPDARDPPAPPAEAAIGPSDEAASESPEPAEAEAPRPDVEEPVAGAAAMVDAGPAALASSAEHPGVGMVPRVAAAVAPPPDVPVEAPPASTILPAAMVATAGRPPRRPPRPRTTSPTLDAHAGDDELLEPWAIAEDDKAKDDAEPSRRRRVLGAAAGRWSAMRRGERVNFVLYALTGVSIVAMTLELLAGPDAIPTDVATTPGGSASQT